MNTLVLRGALGLTTLAMWLVLSLAPSAHDFSAGNVTWNREISRVVFERCASCHRDGGGAFPLTTYREAQPRATEIKNSVLARRMPPWGAVKGFGDFRNDQGLTQEQVELIASWVEGGMSRGNNPKVLPELPAFKPVVAFRPSPAAVQVRGPLTLSRAIVLDGVMARGVSKSTSLQITATLPDGSIKPLVWLYEYDEAHAHPFLLRKPLSLPVGTRIDGVRPPASLLLLPLDAGGTR